MMNYNISRGHKFRKECGKDIRRIMKMMEEPSGHEYKVSIVNSNELENQSLTENRGRKFVCF
jgi:hypothetical protein